jgi:hypothetical protein
VSGLSPNALCRNLQTWSLKFILTQSKIY